MEYDAKSHRLTYILKANETGKTSKIIIEVIDAKGNKRILESEIAL